MPWKTTSRRCLHVGPKVKLPQGHPPPEPAESMAIKVEDHAPDERGDVAKERNSFEVLGLAAALPDANDTFCFDKYISDLEDDQESDSCHSLFNDSGTSTLGQSASSFMSWLDESELEKSKEVQRLVDEIDDAIYDGVPFPETDHKALEILHQIKASRLHLRVVGGNFQNIPKDVSAVEEDAIEVLASHGVYEDVSEVLPSNSVLLPKEDTVDIFEVKQNSDVEFNSDENVGLCNDVKCISSRTGSTAATCAKSNDISRFREKVKSYVMDQLGSYILSEALKVSMVREKNISSLSEDDEEIVDDKLYSMRPNTREEEDCGEDEDDDDDDIFHRPHCVQQQNRPPVVTTSNLAFTSFLHVSPMTIHPLPRKSVAHLRYSTPNYNFDIPLCLNRSPPNRNSVKRNYCAPSQISVISLSKPNTTLPEKGVKLRGYHSAAVVKKPGVLERRFSITAGHERFLEPLVETRSANKHRQQASAPSSPAKWLRRHTLPPINPNGLPRLSKSPDTICSNTSLITTKLLENSKTKVSLIPVKVPVLGTGLTRLQLAKELLEQADQGVLWNTGGAYGSKEENIKDIGKSKNERRPNGRNRY